MNINLKYPSGYYVYAYTRKSNDTPYYIGKGKGRRCIVKHSVPVPKDRSRIVIIAQSLTDVGACALERRLIRWYGRKDLGTGILRNRTDGGDGTAGRIISEEEIQKRRMHPISAESKAKRSKALKGKTRTLEQKLHLRSIAKKRTTNHFKDGFKGKKHSQVSLDIKREKMLGKQWYNNGSQELMFNTHPGPEWSTGRLAGSQSWWNNGSEVKRSSTSPGPEWVKGRLRGTKGTKGMSWYNNGVVNTVCQTSPGPEWQPGMISISKK